MTSKLTSASFKTLIEQGANLVEIGAKSVRISHDNGISEFAAARQPVRLYRAAKAAGLSVKWLIPLSKTAKDGRDCREAALKAIATLTEARKAELRSNAAFMLALRKIDLWSGIFDPIKINANIAFVNAVVGEIVDRQLETQAEFGGCA